MSTPSDPSSPTKTPTTKPRWRRLRQVVLPVTLDVSNGFESSRVLGKWLVVASMIGVVAGLGAVLFARTIEFTTGLLMGDLVGYMPPMPIGEGEPVLNSIARPWLLPLVTMLGGLVSGIIVFRFAPEAEGHGTDAAIEAIHHKNAHVSPKVPPIKLLSSAITIGSGGSGGREGPAAQISSGFASFLAYVLKLNNDDRRIAVAAGMGAGIGAIFRAPLGGALMAAEILYLHDLEVEVLLPGLIASIVGYSVFGAIEGFEPIFGAQPDLGFSDPVTLVYYAGLGLVCGLGGLLYARCFYGTMGLFHRFRIPLYVKPAIGGLLVGLLGLWIKGSLHTGYGWVQISMTDQLLALPLWTVIMLPFAKIVATSFSIGSGGSGGIFGPGMVIGGMLGATSWRLGHGVLPHLPASPAPFVIIGMMALFGGIAHAPFAMMLMVAEMTGNLSLLAPAMVAVAVSTMLVGNHSIYSAQLNNRAASPAHRLRNSFPLLSALFVRDAVTPIIPASATGVSVRTNQRLDDALQQMADADTTEATVLDGSEIVGRLTYRDALTAYKAMLARGVHRAERLPSSSLLFDYVVDAHSPVAGVPLREAQLPRHALVAAVSREGETIFPNANTVLVPGDTVTVIATADSAPALHQRFRGD